MKFQFIINNNNFFWKVKRKKKKQFLFWRYHDYYCYKIWPEYFNRFRAFRIFIFGNNFYRNTNERYCSQSNGILNSEEESMSEKQTTNDLMYSAISVGLSAFKSNSPICQIASNDRSKVFYFKNFCYLEILQSFLILNIKYIF